MEELVSEGLRLGAHFARPAGVTRVPGIARAARVPAWRRRRGRRREHRPDVVRSRSRAKSGWAGLTFTFRGTGPSEGDFSIEGWLADVRAAVDALHARTDVTGVWIAGFRLGGTLAIIVAADDDRVRGIATFAAPASLRTWVREPEWFLEYARRTGVLRTAGLSRPIPTRGSGRSRNLDPVGRGGAHRAAPVAARARQRRRRRAGRRRAPARRRRRRVRRAADRRERSAPPAPRPARDRRAARLARPPGTLSRRALALRRRGRRRASRRARTRGCPAGRGDRAWSGRRRGAGPRPAGRAPDRRRRRRGRRRGRRGGRRSRRSTRPRREHTL